MEAVAYKKFRLVQSRAGVVHGRSGDVGELPFRDRPAPETASRPCEAARSVAHGHQDDVTALAKTHKPSTRTQIRNVLGSALKEAERLDMISRNPLDKLRGALPLGVTPEAQPAESDVR